MLLKWIRCTVPARSREAFSHAQTRWSALRGVAGFRGQVGGWSAADPATACVLGLWRDRETYGSFMRDVHDRVADGSGQDRTYESISVVLCESRLEMRGLKPRIDEAVASAGFLRTADCRVRPGRSASFLQMQQSVWLPGLKAAGGMLAGSLAAIDGSDRRYLVATLWADEASHARYVRRDLEALRARAAVEADVDQIAGTFVELDPGWTVVAAMV
jgi:heme-degrading monooxygenase HmoA